MKKANLHKMSLPQTSKTLYIANNQTHHQDSQILLNSSRKEEILPDNQVSIDLLSVSKKEKNLILNPINTQASEIGTQTDFKIIDEHIITQAAAIKVKSFLEEETLRLKQEFENDKSIYKNHMMKLKSQAMSAEQLRIEAATELQKLREELDKQHYIEHLRSQKLYDYLLTHKKKIAELERTKKLDDNPIEFDFPNQPKSIRKFMSSNRINGPREYNEKILQDESLLVPIRETDYKWFPKIDFQERAAKKGIFNNELDHLTASQTINPIDYLHGSHNIKSNKAYISEEISSDPNFDGIWLLNNSRLRTLEENDIEVDPEKHKNLERMLKKYML